MKVNKMCVEVLQMSNDGDDLAPKHLNLVELVVNGQANHERLAELEKIHQQLKKDRYSKWYFDIYGLTLGMHGSVYWFGETVEHFSYLAGNYSEEAKLAAIKLVTRIQRRELDPTFRVACNFAGF